MHTSTTYWCVKISLGKWLCVLQIEAWAKSFSHSQLWCITTLRALLTYNRTSETMELTSNTVSKSKPRNSLPPLTQRHRQRDNANTMRQISVCLLRLVCNISFNLTLEAVTLLGQKKKGVKESVTNPLFSELVLVFVCISRLTATESSVSSQPTWTEKLCAAPVLPCSMCEPALYCSLPKEREQRRRWAATSSWHLERIALSGL